MSWGCFAVSRSILLTLRHNLTQELLADIHTVPQSTISRVVAAYTPLIAEAHQACVPGVEDPRPRSVSTSSTAPLEVYSRATPRPAKPLVRQHLRTAMNKPLGVLLVMVEASRTVLRQAPHDGGEPAGGLHPGRAPRLDLPTPAG